MAKVTNKKTINKSSSKMTKEKSGAKKTVKVIKKLRPASAGETLSARTSMFTSKEAVKGRFSFVSTLLLIVVIGSALYLLASKYKSFIIAGTVNSSPVYRWELNSKMAEKYGKQSFEEIVNDRLLAEELKKNKITVTDQEVTDEMTKLVAQYGGQEAFQEAISQFGLTEDKAKESIKQSLGLKKLVEKNYKIEISDEAVKKYYDDNKATFGTKKLEEVSSDIKDNLYQQEVYAKSQEWFSEVRKNAKVTSFI
jgi:hypothetical protein